MQSTAPTVSPATPLCVMPTTNGHAMPLTAAEFPLYQLHVTRFFVEYRPKGNDECTLVQRIADNEWRIDRIARTEMGYYTYGQVEFAHLFPEYDAALRAALIQVHTHKTYTRQLSSLSAQESRLRRYVKMDSAELRTMQSERLEREKQQKTLAASTPAATTVPSQPENGFEFSNSHQTAEAKPQPDHRTSATHAATAQESGLDG